MENTSRARADQLETEIKAIESQLEGLGAVDPARFEQRLLKPAKTDVAPLRYDLLWI